jgi:hypothetical protein
LLEGIIPEMHSQNVLFGFDEHWRLQSIILRDMESHDKDITLMQKLGISNNLKSNPFKCIDDSQKNYYIKHSFMFDHKLGEYLIEDILNVVSNGDKKIFSCLCRNIKNYVLNNYGNFINGVSFFPLDGFWYKFLDEIIDRTQIERPYDVRENPLFR